MTHIAKLETAELDRLARYEAKIKSGLASFIEVGEALSAIRDQRLYLATHGTFEDYCREKWGMSASRARQLVGASSVAQSVTMVTLTSERQARELARVEPERRQEVLEAALAATGGKITAEALRKSAALSKNVAIEALPLPTVATANKTAKPLHMTEARELWQIAKGRLDNIRTKDPERVSVLMAVIDYAKDRINRDI